MASSLQAPNIYEDTARVPTKLSALRAILSSKTHRRYPSADDAVSSQGTYISPPYVAPLMCPGEEPRSNPRQRPLGERAPNRDVADGTPSSGRSTAKEGRGGLHKKTKSAVSLKSLKNYMERRDSRPEEMPEAEGVDLRPKKTKSANSLTAMLKRSQRGRREEDPKEARDKENRSPSDLCDSMPPPSWTYYSTRPSEDQTEQRRPLEKGRNLEEEVSLYTPKDYGPAQQRNFYGYNQPSLTKRSDIKLRPQSDRLSGNRKMKDILKRTSSDEGPPPAPIETSQDYGHRRLSRPGTYSEREQRQESKPKETSRVQAAISAFNAKGQNTDLQKRLNSKDLEGEFEKLLDSRNIPHNMRERMRSLDTNIKADFIRKDQTDSAPQSANGSASTDSSSRRGRGKEQKDERHSHDGKGSRSRSRSRRFSFSKGAASPTRKQRPDSGIFHRRPKSMELPQSIGLSKILSPSTSTASLSGAACVDTASDPSDFVHYLREIQKPEMIDAGKLHKLRILLRNETVSWVDDFITEGGMDEIVQLLYRIMKVEWRGEHEDALLHEALLCLKALGTTSAALKQLTEIESELFSALLSMLFDKENKGPSEFTTRGIIINLLFTQLSTAPSGETATRALRILSYLRDPTPPEEDQPLSFIANIYQSRPYRVWCKEVTNVTKEVFWIFLHHLNVIPITSSDKPTFQERHFPLPRPPVPAAPYVGGVEWDATNYLAAHLDLMNGLIACLPTADERNSLRMELRASGFEKVMGGSLRTCKEKFYSSIHDCLRTWVAAAVEDEWPYTFVREGPPRPEPGSPPKSPVKIGGSPKKPKPDEKPPKLDLNLELAGEPGPSTKGESFGNWL